MDPYKLLMVRTFEFEERVKDQAPKCFISFFNLFLSELWNDYFLNIDKNAKIWLFVCILAQDKFNIAAIVPSAIVIMALFN